jgi:hypothetical protein
MCVGFQLIIKGCASEMYGIVTTAARICIRAGRNSTLYTFFGNHCKMDVREQSDIEEDGEKTTHFILSYTSIVPVFTLPARL